MRNAKGQFTSEFLRGNQFAKGNPPNRTSFKPNQPLQSHPNWKGGLQKHRDGYFMTIAHHKRIKRARLVWENEYGEIPRGYVVYHIDQDKYNDNITNLELINRAELIKRNRKNT